uniref:Uncharacterized protein n=1 Tax=Acidithiobacillus sulfuriphilus TaxID=1867749 RepID=A0A3M8RCE9_9PROT|nr:hypothetical protein EC580_04875 [Acidithiobacillus sulfuriphilus]
MFTVVTAWLEVKSCSLVRTWLEKFPELEDGGAELAFTWPTFMGPCGVDALPLSVAAVTDVPALAVSARAFMEITMEPAHKATITALDNRRLRFMKLLSGLEVFSAGII